MPIRGLRDTAPFTGMGYRVIRMVVTKQRMSMVQIHQQRVENPVSTTRHLIDGGLPAP